MFYPLFDYGLTLSPQNSTINNEEWFYPAINNNSGTPGPNDYFDVALTNFINGVYQITTNQASLFGNYTFTQVPVNLENP